MVRLAVVGLRNIGKGHVKRAKTLSGVSVIAGVDTDETRRNEAREQFGFEYVSAEVERVLDDPQIDGVILALPNHLHAPFTVRALAAGKHVLVEKPIAGDSREVAQMIEARDRSGKVLMVGMNQRFSPVQFAIRDLIRKGTIGEVYISKTFWNQRFMGEGLFSRGPWGFKKEVAGGGPLLDLGIHKLDLLMFLLDFPKVESVMGFTSEGIGRVEAKKRGVEYGIEDFGMGLIRLKNGGCIHLEASYYHNQFDENAQEFLLCGTRGVIKDANVSTIEAGQPKPVDYAPATGAPSSCVEHFCRVIRGQEPLSSTAEEALIGLRIVEAIYASAVTGNLVRF